MNSLRYTDAEITDLDASDWDLVRESPETARQNLAGDRVILKWAGPDPDFVEDLGLTVRNHADALEYYGDPANGWTE